MKLEERVEDWKGSEKYYRGRIYTVRDKKNAGQDSPANTVRFKTT